MPTPSSSTPRHNPQWWARYWSLKKRAFIRRKIWVRSFHEFGDLYGGPWDAVEAVLIRNECEEQGVPMGYGRVTRAPKQLAWGIAVPIDPGAEDVDSEALAVAIESEDDATR